MQFTRVGNNALPYSKCSSEKFGSVVKITNMQEADEGRYKCTGENSQGEKEYEFNVDVQGESRSERSESEVKGSSGGPCVQCVLCAELM